MEIDDPPRERIFESIEGGKFAHAELSTSQDMASADIDADIAILRSPSIRYRNRDSSKKAPPLDGPSSTFPARLARRNDESSPPTPISSHADGDNPLYTHGPPSLFA